MSQILSQNKRKPKFESREEYFLKNGGILLEKQIALSQGQRLVAGQLKSFSSEDVEKAINNYNPDLILGSSHLRIVYKGILEDRIVAVRAPRQVKPDLNLFDLHLTEGSMSLVMNHVNIEKLIGCCLESFTPILVHEFIPNGSLFRHLHDDGVSKIHIQWVDRLKVATVTAYALSYVHNALSKPVVHRHLDSNAILLDHSFNAKLANLSFSVSITPGDETPQRWPVEGVPGYIDPEYIETQEVTDKCDVYSFGVLLLELLTRRNPILLAISGTDLVDVFISAVEKNCMIKMIDSEVLEQGTKDEIQQLALKCVADKGIERPTMIEIVNQLRQIHGPENQCHL